MVAMTAMWKSERMTPRYLPPGLGARRVPVRREAVSRRVADLGSRGEINPVRVRVGDDRVDAEVRLRGQQRALHRPRDVFQRDQQAADARRRQILGLLRMLDGIGLAQAQAEDGEVVLRRVDVT